MNDEPNVEPVDLSPTRAELIARVRARGRQIRARRRLAITGLTALVVLAIAVPAVAIGTRSSSNGVTPAAVVHGTGDFRMAVVTLVEKTTPGAAAPPFGDQCTSSTDGKLCYVLGATVATRHDVKNATVVRDGGQWSVNLTMDVGAVHRLAAQVNEQVAIIVGGRVVSAPVVLPGITGTTVTVDAVSTREQAITLATEILGRPSAHVDPSLPTLMTTIELPDTTFVAGSVVQATLVIENTTDAAVTIEAPGNCHMKWAVSLTNAAVPGDVAFTDECGSQRTIVKPGVNRFPVTVSTKYQSCTGAGGVGQPSDVHCLPGGNIPPLPPGNYQAVLTTSPAGLLSAPPVAVHLTAGA